MSHPAFDAQVETLLRLRYPAMFAMSDSAFADALAGLRAHAPPDPVGAQGRVGFVIVVHSPRAPVSLTFALAARRGQRPVQTLYPRTAADFVPQLTLPQGDAYLLIDIDRGAEHLNATPAAALVAITDDGRSPLTVEEGVALMTHAPELLQPKNGFSLLASRCGDKRVPALWLSRRTPKLGWCWAGNPHTWLGSASCARRAGAVHLHTAAAGAARPRPRADPRRHAP